MTEAEYTAVFAQIVADPDLTDMEKLPRTFNLVTRKFISHYEHDAELARAMGDQDTAVREQIKAGVLNASRGMYEHCYRQITGVREGIWHE